MSLTGYAHSSFNLNLRPRVGSYLGYADYRIRASFFFIFSFFILIFALFLLYAPLILFSYWSTARVYLSQLPKPTGVRVNLSVKKRSRFFTTVQRGPMAHRQWSQEQYRFLSFIFTFRVFLPLRPTLLLPYKELTFFIHQLHPALVYQSTLLSFYRVVIGRLFYFRACFDKT